MIIDNIADIILIVIVMASIGLSIWRGFSRELLLLGSFVLSMYVAYKYGAKVGAYCTFLSAEILRQGFGYFLAFTLTSIITGLTRALLLKALQLNNAGVIDRIAGGVFGLVRGGIAASLLISTLNNTPITKQPWWEKSYLIPQIEHTTLKSLDTIPQEWKENVLAIIENFNVEYA